MPDPKYENLRQSIPADIRRTVEVESGHACAISRCGEHTYLEIHHINEDREDNRVENLILLCDKHHKMAHADVIDRKSLRAYKAELKKIHGKSILERLETLEKLMELAPKNESREPIQLVQVSDPELPVKYSPPRAEFMYSTLEQLALAKYERDNNFFIERGAKLVKGDAQLNLDAIRQDDSLPADLVIEVRWLRKRYLDAPVWVHQIDVATSAYELITGRKARGILIYVVPKSSMKEVNTLYYTAEELEKIERKPEILIYSYEDLGFNPGAISAQLFQSNLNSKDGVA